MKAKREKPVKKKYEKPLLRVVNIAPGMQTLGIGCKLNAGSLGFADNPCLNGVCSVEPGS